MVTCLGEVHIWTLKNQTIIPDDDIGCFTYHEKIEAVTNVEQPYHEEKRLYIESRDSTWAPKNKRPDKLRDTLKEAEELLSSQKCVHVRWLSRRLLQLFLSNGCILYFVVSVHTGDVDRIFIDKTLVGKLSGETPSDVLTTDGYIVFAYPDKSKLDYIYLFKRPPPGETMKKVEKLSTYDPRISQVELPGPVGRRLDRHLVCNLHHDMVLAWWPTASEEAWPWSPMTGEKERANLVLFAASGPLLELVTYTRTDCDPIEVTFRILTMAAFFVNVEEGSTPHKYIFSSLEKEVSAAKPLNVEPHLVESYTESLTQPHQIFTVEQAVAARGEVSTDLCMYDNNRNKIQRLTVTSIPMKSSVVCCGRNPAEDKVLLGCEDGTLVLYDEYRKCTQAVATSMIPKFVCWHPSGTILAVASTRGQIYFYDMALSPMTFQLNAEIPSPKSFLELGPYFRSPPTLDRLHWSPCLEHQEYIAECVDSLFIAFDRGPLCMLQFQLGVVSQGQMAPLLLLNQYVKCGHVNEAISLMNGLNWNVDGPTCYAGLSLLANYLLRQSLTAEREAQLEAALGTFYAPARPLSEVTVLEYRDPISRLARRFFHHLLRFTRFDKAFLLAVDIGARDLFMDIHYLAKDKGETALAEVARRKAEQIDNESIGTESVDGFEDEISEEESWLGDSCDEDGAEPAVDGPPPRPPKRPTPSLGKGPPPPIPPELQYAVPPSDPRFIPRRQHAQTVRGRQPWEQPLYMSSAEAALQQLEEEATTQMFNEYTAALLDEIPPPLSMLEDDSDEQAADGTSKPVKVIHFGLV